MLTNNQAPTSQADIALSDVSKRIYALRGCQVMLDSDLAEIYQVESKNLKRAVKRNIERFPEDFMFEPTKRELELLRCQFGTSKNRNVELLERPSSCGFSDSEISNETVNEALRCQIGTSKISLENRGGNRYGAFVFTEPGVAMLSSVLHSERAIQVNISIMRAFIQLRAHTSLNKNDLIPKLDSLQSDLSEIRYKLEKFTVKPERIIETGGVRENTKVEAIQNAVAQYCGLSVDNLKSQQRTKSVSLARQIAIYLMRKHLSLSFVEIGRLFGKRDHTTILHAYRKIHVDAEDNDVVKKAMSAIKRQLDPLLS